jgi:hypothetical protein
MSRFEIKITFIDADCREFLVTMKGRDSTLSIEQMKIISSLAYAMDLIKYGRGKVNNYLLEGDRVTCRETHDSSKVVLTWIDDIIDYQKDSKDGIQLHLRFKTVRKDSDVTVATMKDQPENNQGVQYHHLLSGWFTPQSG